MTAAFTLGFDHVGLTVRDVRASAHFFVGCLGWRVVGERQDYPAIFVSDGSARLTLWQVADPLGCVTFDRRDNIGLHHLALKVADKAQLDLTYAQVADWPGVVVEFSPELSGSGPKVHAMFYEPGGNRIELAWDPR